MRTLYVSAFLLLATACAPTPAPPPAAGPAATADSPLTEAAVAAPDTLLSVRRIMQGEAFVGTWPSEIVWAVDGSAIYFRWREPEAEDSTTAIYRVGLDGERVRLGDGDVPPLPRGADWTADRSRAAFAWDGDVYVAGRDGREWRITESTERYQDVHLAPGGEIVYFRSGDALFAARPEEGRIRQIAELRTQAAPEDTPDDRERFLRDQELELLDAVRERVAEREAVEHRDSLRRTVPRIYLGEGAGVARTRVSPSGRYLLVGVRQTPRAERTLVPEFVTETGYVRPIEARPKVGDMDPPTRLGILDLESGETRWIDGDEDGARIYFVSEWSPAEDRLLLLGVSGDYTRRWIETRTPDLASVELHRLHDPAWIGGPGFATAAWEPDGRHVYYVSEETGFAHLYRTPATGGPATALTVGEWEVHDVQLAPGGDRFYLTTNRPHPGVRVIERLPVAGGRLEPVVDWHGWNTHLLSPDGERMALLHSTADRPPELYLQPTDGGEGARVTRSASRAFLEGPWIRPEVISIPASDGVGVPSRIYRPEELGAERNGAAVIFVHGAGYLQNAHHGWSSYYREYMFHHLLAQRGYLVLDLDFRASAGYGRDWRTAIHEHMGGRDLEDHVDAARWLVETEGIDARRIGLYGGSYGGFITLMAMFLEPDVFAAGAALRSVTDWSHYNHGYTSRILGHPDTNPEAFRRSSPIYFAEGLEGHLLITHGMVDVNVQFQDVVRLAQRLIELGKDNWEMAVYPVEDHAFRRADSWADQYRRILELFEGTIGAGE